MKYTSRCFTLSALLAASFLSIPSQADQSWQSGGDGIWNTAGGTSPIDGTTTTGVNNWSNSTGGGTWNGGNDNATFSGVGQTILVDDTGNGGPTTVDFSDFQSGTWTIAPNTPTDVLTEFDNPNSSAIIQLEGNSGNVTYTVPIQINDVGYNADEQAFVNNESNSLLTLGSIDFGPETRTSPAAVRLQLNANDGGGQITLAGAYTTSGGVGGSITFGNNGQGTYNIASTADFSNYHGGQNSFTGAGTVNIDNSSFRTDQTIAFYGDNADTINFQNTNTVKFSVYNSIKNDQSKGTDGDGVSDTGRMVFNQSTAGITTWAPQAVAGLSSGWMELNGSNATFKAVEGGRLVVAGDLHGSSALGINYGATGSAETGTVVIGANDYNGTDGNGLVPAAVGTNLVAADIQSGTVVTTNGAGTSAFGNATGDNTLANQQANNGNANPNGIVLYGKVKLEAGATLAGTGYTGVYNNNGTIINQIVEVEDAAGIIAPGDKGQSSLGIASSVGTLHLIGGVHALSGLTMDFKLATPGSSDALDMGAGDFTLGGVVTVNLTAFDGTFAPGSTGETFVLASGSGAWSDAGATFNFSAPLGDSVTGYSFNAVTDQFTVTVAAPEPSTWAMMLAGVVFLVGFTQRRLRA